MGVLDYVWMGILAVFQGPPLFSVLGLPVPVTVVMVLFGSAIGILVGAIPGLGSTTAMAIALPILISIFGYTPDALLPVLGFLVGVMKGATLGGAVPAILFNTPGTADSFMTTLDGHQMARRGKGPKALRVAHLSSVTGDTLSDIVLFVCAPFLAVLVEAYLDLPEKTALIILSLTFIAGVIGGSPGKGLISAGLGLLVAYVATGQDFYPRLSLNTEFLSNGFPITTAVLGVLVIGAVFEELEKIWREKRRSGVITEQPVVGDQRLHWSDIRRIAPYIGQSACIGTVIGALPGLGSTLAATLGYTLGRARHDPKAKNGDLRFGDGVAEGVASTEAANSAVSGANLIPVLSLGIPGNVAAIFIILAADSIGGFNPGPAVFRFTVDQVNSELVIAFGLFTTMVIANLFNWTLGGAFMRWIGGVASLPKATLLPCVLLLTLTAVYIQETRMEAIWFLLGFGVLGYFMRAFGITPLPFVIAFILAKDLETTARQAFSATGGDPFFLLDRPVAAAFMALAVGVLVVASRKRGSASSNVAAADRPMRS